MTPRERKAVIAMKSGAVVGLVMLGLLSDLWLAVPAGAGPRERVGEIVGSVSAVLRDSALQSTERQARVRTIIDEAFDLEAMGQQTLGSRWQALTPVQRDEFVGLFAELFKRSYTRLVLRFLGDRKTSYVTESVAGNRAGVETVLEGGKEERLPVGYRLARKHEQWQVVDVVIDGVSLAEGYRAQFERIVRTSSYDTLLRRMRGKAQ